MTESVNKSKEMKIKVKGDYKLMPLNELKKSKFQRNKHPQDQIEVLAKIMREGGVRHTIDLSERSGNICFGHGRKMAALLNGWTHYPVRYQQFDSDDEEYICVQNDNAIAARAELDLAAINIDLAEIGPFDIELLGIKDFVVEPMDNIPGGLDDKYTKNIKAPIYEPKGDKPSEHELYDLQKTMELLEKIKQKNPPKNIRTFLEFSAHRHIVFDYEKIAEYYSHAEPEIQELMEASALVIIDFKKAIEQGFAKLTDALAEAFLDEDE